MSNKTNEAVTQSGVRIWQRDEIESPCISVCTIHPVEKICTGCYRTIQEIGQWSRMDPEERRAVMNELPNRAPKLKQRRGGRRARLSAPPKL